MNKTKSYLLSALLIPLMLSQTACTVSQTSTALGVAQIAVSSVVAALDISGRIPVAYQPAVSAWANDATAAFALTATELTTSDTSAVKSLKISGYWTATLKDFSLINPVAQPYVSLAQSDINAFLTLVTPPATATANAEGGFSAHGVTVVPAQVPLTRADKRKLASIAAAANKDHIKLAKHIKSSSFGV